MGGDPMESWSATGAMKLRVPPLSRTGGTRDAPGALIAGGFPAFLAPRGRRLFKARA
jgi:hypothetical protein